SGVATVSAGRRTFRPANRSPSKAWALVTSWTSCRSIYSTVGWPAGASTTWASQIFWNIVRGEAGMRIASVRGGGRFTGRISSAAEEPLFYSPRGGLGRPAELRSPRKQTGDLAVLRAYPLVHLLVPIRSTLLNIFQSLP